MFAGTGSSNLPARGWRRRVLALRELHASNTCVLVAVGRSHNLTNGVGASDFAARRLLVESCYREATAAPPTSMLLDPWSSGDDEAIASALVIVLMVDALFQLRRPAPCTARRTG